MIEEPLYPTSIPCGFCGASTALVREQIEELSVGQGLCSECRHMVISVAGPWDAAQAFLDCLESIDYPKDQDVSPLPLASRKLAGNRAAAFN